LAPVPPRLIDKIDVQEGIELVLIKTESTDVVGIPVKVVEELA